MLNSKIMHLLFCLFCFTGNAFAENVGVFEISKISREDIVYAEAYGTIETEIPYRARV